MITATSLHQANVVFLFTDATPPPANAAFMALADGPAAAGVNFVDDEVLGTKLLNVPKAGISIVWEGRRLRIEDQRGAEPKDSGLAHQALVAVQKLMAAAPMSLKGLGFNFDTYHQVREVMRVQDMLAALEPQAMDFGSSVLDFGWQWTVMHKNGKELEGYFVKITAPLELAVHYNRHVNRETVPNEKELDRLFRESYDRMNATVATLHLS